jgi:hypothetical protein
MDEVEGALFAASLDRARTLEIVKPNCFDYPTSLASGVEDIAHRGH